MTAIMFSIMQQQTPQACIVDLTPPTGANLSSLTNNPDGSLKASWPAATDSNGPIRYEVYIQKATATGLFNVANIVAVVYKLTFDIFRDALDVAITQGETYFVGVRAVDALGNRNSNTTSASIVATGIGYNNLLNLIPGKVWDELEASHTIAGSFGKLASDMKIGIDTLLARLTLARAGLLDNLNFLDVAVSSRLSTASFVAPDNTGIALLNTKLTNTRAALLDNLALVDASISSRASNAGLSVVNSNVLLTESEANALTRYGNLLTAIGNIPVVTPPSAGAIADAVWDETLTGHNVANTYGLLVSLLELDSAAASRALAILTAIGNIPVTTPPSASQIADAVWDELLAGHLAAGSTGKKLNDGSALDADGIRSAVWDAPIADYIDAGSTGKKLADTFEASGFVPAGQAIEVTFSQDSLEVEISDNSQIEITIDC